jgi:hypothetical protein
LPELAYGKKMKLRKENNLYSGLKY